VRRIVGKLDFAQANSIKIAVNYYLPSLLKIADPQRLLSELWLAFNLLHS